MKKIVFAFIFFTLTLSAQVKILTWNVENLGNSKSDSTIQYIASVIKHYDVVALQEIVAGNGGAQAVSILADELNRTGNKWEYTVSNPTESSSYKTERYAFLWKTAKVKQIGNAWLENNYQLQIDREPYFATFEHNKKKFTLVNFHAITKSKQPETEIKYFKFLPETYPTLNLIFIGDFNCPQSHTVFNPLKKMGYLPVFTDQKTSLKKSCAEDNCLSNEFDNIWYNTNKVETTKPKAILFYKDFNDFNTAREITDHIPLAVTIQLK
ncbi:MAG TPA: endonuclease/exonuclease/phosphatase family protein [Flavobacterium sp.]|nr:endonuclease/exonuclease/phosphatase family protein [Flavobacterium sp.]